jgi:hypothetical protein
MNIDYKIRPEIMLICDTPAAQRTEKEKLLLERHFNDLYAVFLHKLTEFALRSNFSEEETIKLKTFFDELLKARSALEK